MGKSNYLIHLDYASAQSSLHVLCKPYSIMIMLYVNELHASARIDLYKSIFMELQVGRSIRNLTNELHMAETYVIQIREKTCRIFELTIVVDHKCL